MCGGELHPQGQLRLVPVLSFYDLHSRLISKQLFILPRFISSTFLGPSTSNFPLELHIKCRTRTFSSILFFSCLQYIDQRNILWWFWHVESWSQLFLAGCKSTKKRSQCQKRTLAFVTKYVGINLLGLLHCLPNSANRVSDNGSYIWPFPLRQELNQKGDLRTPPTSEWKKKLPVKICTESE